MSDRGRRRTAYSHSKRRTQPPRNANSILKLMKLQWKWNWQDDNESIDFPNARCGQASISFHNDKSHTFDYFSRFLLKNIIRNEFAQRASQVNAKCNGNQHPIIAYGFLYLEAGHIFRRGLPFCEETTNKSEKIETRREKCQTKSMNRKQGSA